MSGRGAAEHPRILDNEGIGAHFTAEDFCRRAGERLRLDVPDLGPLAVLRPAAVLVPVVLRDGDAHLILTTRSRNLSKHAGQIAFPGGRIDPEDATPLDAALREAREEIDLDARFVTPLGWLDPYAVGSGFIVLPLVATVSPDYVVRANPDEVEDVFEVPLGFLMTPENHQTHSRQVPGGVRHYLAMPWGKRYIWGATAAMLRNLYERVYDL